MSAKGLLGGPWYAPTRRYLKIEQLMHFQAKFSYHFIDIVGPDCYLRHPATTNFVGLRKKKVRKKKSFLIRALMLSVLI